MLSKNNSKPSICVNNLIQIARGEVPYDRVKGVSTAQLDRPIAQSPDEMVGDVEWMLSVYEPRAVIESVEATPADTQNGHFAIKATINTIKEADE